MDVIYENIEYEKIKLSTNRQSPSSLTTVAIVVVDTNTSFLVITPLSSFM